MNTTPDSRRRLMLMSTKSPHSNLAARMGRWSASHWKTATFGWIAFVLVAFALGDAVGTKTIDPNTAGPGESGRMDRILDAGFKRPAAESVLDPEHDPRGHRPGVRGRGRGRRRQRLRYRRRAERQHWPGLGGRTLRARRVRDRRRGRRGRRQARPRPRKGGRGPAGPSRALHRRVRPGERGRRDQHRVRGGPLEGRAPVAPDHARDPRDRVRGALAPRASRCFSP